MRWPAKHCQNCTHMSWFIVTELTSNEYFHREKSYPSIIFTCTLRHEILVWSDGFACSLSLNCQKHTKLALCLAYSFAFVDILFFNIRNNANSFVNMSAPLQKLFGNQCAKLIKNSILKGHSKYRSPENVSYCMKRYFKTATGRFSIKWIRICSGMFFNRLLTMYTYVTHVK